MKIISTALEIKKLRSNTEGTVGFVPTMGALHLGHKRLLDQSRQENDLSILSIFTNPTQFNNSSDLENYPKTLDADLALASSAGVDLVFTPSYSEIYPDSYRYKLSENEFSKILCGAHRPGHFDGVLTVVLKLLNITSPTKAYFGEKDFQQLHLIKKMVEAFFMPVDIVAVPTVREESGLAMSSRNMRLKSAERLLAPEIFKAITKFNDEQAARHQLESLGFKVEYLESHFGRRFVAAWLGDVRLIDNVQI